MLLALRWLAQGERERLPASAALLGTSVLAKGFLPLVLALPLLWMGRRRWFDWFRPQVVGAFAVITLPWYVLCFLRNGWPFINKFFWEHQVERFSTPALAPVVETTTLPLRRTGPTRGALAGALQAVPVGMPLHDTEYVVLTPAPAATAKL